MLGAPLPVLEQPEIRRGRDGLAARPRLELAEDRRDVVVDRPRREDELARRSRAFRFPAARSCSTSSSRAVSPAGLARVAGRGPRGTRCPGRGAPAARASPPGLRRDGRAPRALRAAPPRRPPPRARAPPRTGTSARATPRRRPRASPASCSRYGSAIQSGASSSAPAFHCQYASSPANQRCRFSSASGYTACASAAVRSRSPASQAASARAAWTWPSRCRCPPGSRELERLVERLPPPGSPRRARRRPSAMSPVIRLIGSTGRARTAPRRAAPSSQRPR